jgi:hypothetical protein
MERAVFLARDGTINEEIGWLNHLEAVGDSPGRPLRRRGTGISLVGEE